MEKPNILFITTDEQHLRTLSCYGAQTGTTPNLDALSQCGDIYTNAYTCSPEVAPTSFRNVTIVWRL